MALHRLKLQSLERRRLCTDLVWGYKILFGIVDVQPGEFFEFNVRPSRGHRHQYKLYKTKCVVLVNVLLMCGSWKWNSLYLTVLIHISFIHSFIKTVLK